MKKLQDLEMYINALEQGDKSVLPIIKDKEGNEVITQPSNEITKENFVRFVEKDDILKTLIIELFGELEKPSGRGKKTDENKEKIIIGVGRLRLVGKIFKILLENSNPITKTKVLKDLDLMTTRMADVQAAKAAKE